MSEDATAPVAEVSIDPLHLDSFSSRSSSLGAAGTSVEGRRGANADHTGLTPPRRLSLTCPYAVGAGAEREGENNGGKGRDKEAEDPGGRPEAENDAVQMDRPPPPLEGEEKKVEPLELRHLSSQNAARRRHSISSVETNQSGQVTDEVDPPKVKASRHSSMVTTRSSMATKRSSQAECPFFSGASKRNTRLMSQTTRSSVVAIKMDSAEMKRLQALGASLSELEYTVEYSYTKPSEEFKRNLAEDDLFGKPSTDGFFTREGGILIPDYQNKLDTLLRSRGRLWYTAGRRMKGLIETNAFMKVIDQMEIVEGDESACPDESLQIASGILAFLTYGYRVACWQNNINYEPAPALQIPWTRISQRLGRRDVYVSIEDVISNVRPFAGSTSEYGSSAQLTPISGQASAEILGKLFCESNVYLKNMLPSILALCRGEWDRSHICTIINEVKGLNRMMGKAIPDVATGNKTIDPVEFASAFQSLTTPLKDGVPALSGGSNLVFICLDLIIGRKKWDSHMGKDMLTHLDWMPLNWRRFAEYLRQKQIFEHVPTDLQYLWTLLKDVYIGERGWLGRHKYRAYQFVELSGALSRLSSKQSVPGAAALKMLEEARLERDPAFTDDRSSHKTCMFKGQIKSVSRVSEDRLTQLVTIESYQPIHIRVGDHVAIIMKNHDDVLWRFSANHGLNIRAMLSPEDGSLTPDWKDRLDFDGLDYSVYNVLLCARLPQKCEKLDIGNMCRILKPEVPRLYSYATIGQARLSREVVKSFDLLVKNTGPGGCSDFLLESTGQEVSFGISMAAKFRIPTRSTRPLVVIAAGSGLGTYLPLLVNTDLPNPKYAFLAFRTEKTVPYLDQYLKEEVHYGRLNLFVELSREDHSLVTDDRRLRHRKSTKRYLDALLLEQTHLIRELAAPLEEGGMGASFYVCGNSDFFSTVRKAFDTIDHDLISSLIQSSRLYLEVQARGGTVGKSRPKPIKMSEMCFHNKMDDYWVAIDGIIYNFTDYLPWHPGGRKILHYVAGTDASVQWDLVNHNVDRMISSQIPAYRVGAFDSSDPLGLNNLLDTITRTENCVNLYEERGDLFEKLYENYVKIQAICERVFEEEFLELLFRLVHDGDVRFRVLRRIWLVKNGRTWDIADNMFKVAPVKGKKRERKPLDQRLASTGSMRPASLEERSRLLGRLLGACELFFLRCKKAIANFEEATEKDSSIDPDALCVKMFYRLIMAYESFYATLSQPLPLNAIRKWDVLRTEVLSRQTFSMRFSHRDETDIPEEFADLCSSTPPVKEAELEFFIDDIVGFLTPQKTLENTADHGIATALIDDWFNYEQERNLFNLADSDRDGIITRKDVVGLNMEFMEDRNIRAVKFFLSKDDLPRESFTFMDFLEIIRPDVARRRSLQRVASYFRKGSIRSFRRSSLMTKVDSSSSLVNVV